jgi:hypothetical protein
MSLNCLECTVVKTKAFLWNSVRVFLFIGFAALVLRAYLS